MGIEGEMTSIAPVFNFGACDIIFAPRPQTEPVEITSTASSSFMSGTSTAAVYAAGAAELY